MQIDYDVGDVVVRIAGDASVLPIGTLRKVAKFYKEDPRGFIGVSFCGFEKEWPYVAKNWKKLPKASDEFTEQMRNLKPHKQKVDA